MQTQEKLTVRMVYEAFIRLYCQLGRGIRIGDLVADKELKIVSKYPYKDFKACWDELLLVGLIRKGNTEELLGHQFYPTTPGEWL